MYLFHFKLICANKSSLKKKKFVTKRASFQKNVHSDSVKESKDFPHSWVPLRLDTPIVRENIVVM